MNIIVEGYKKCLRVAKETTKKKVIILDTRLIAGDKKEWRNYEKFRDQIQGRISRKSCYR